MREQDKKNMLGAWPIYLLLILLIVTMLWFYHNNPPTNADQTLGQAISKNLDPSGLKTIIESRRGWDVAFPESWGSLAEDFSYTTVTGETAKLSDHKGKNVILVFWATWCPPCRAEIPHLVQLRKEFSNKDLEIIAISNESSQTVKSFVEKEGINYTVVAGNVLLPSPFNKVQSIPTAFFLDSEGKIKIATVGVVPEETSKAIFKAGKAS
ncbi:MAG: TlpA family protein disulfide reductase [Sedimentisphaerales bacterium]|nr:TlpA family protein disulfide reductase [Sedimentisphaerales bacterium]